MTKDEFWNLVDKSRRGTEDSSEQTDNLIGLLSALDSKEILSFEQRFGECVRDAYRHDLWAAAYIINGGCSDDGFDYFLGWLIAQGRGYFEAALADPESCGRRVEPGEDVECEEIWNAANGAYEAATGKKDFFDLAPKVTRTLKGKPWSEDTVDQMFPKLAKKFQGD